MKKFVLISVALLTGNAMITAQNWQAFTNKFVFFNNKFEQRSGIPASARAVAVAGDGTLFVSTLSNSPFALSGDTRTPIVGFDAGLNELGFTIREEGLKLFYNPTDNSVFACNHRIFARKKAGANKWQGFNVDKKTSVKPTGEIPMLNFERIIDVAVGRNGEVIVYGTRGKYEDFFATLNNNVWEYKSALSSEAYNLTFDKSGIMWFINQQQLYRFVGGVSQRVSTKTVNNISASYAGEIYASTPDGIEKVDEKGNFTTITNKIARYFYIDNDNVLWFAPEEAAGGTRSINLDNGLKSGIKSAIAESNRESDQKPYQGDNVVRYDINSKVSFVLSPTSSPISGKTLTCITSDAQGNKYFVDNKGIFILKEPHLANAQYNDTWKSIYPYQLTNADFTDNQWCTAFSGDDGSGLVISKDKLGFVKNGSIEYKNLKLPDVKNMSNLFYNYFSCVAADKKGNIYVGTHLKGLYKYGETVCTPMGLDEKTAGKEINVLAVDKQNNLWIGTDKALVKYDGSTFTYFTKKNSDLLNSEINALFVDAGNTLWVGTDGGLFSFDGAAWTAFTKKQNGLTGNKITAITGQGKTIWFAASSDLHSLENGTVKVETKENGKPFSDVQPNGLAITPSGNLWIVAQNTVVFCRKTDGTYLLYNFKNSPLPDSSILPNKFVIILNGEITLYLSRFGLFDESAIPIASTTAGPQTGATTPSNEIVSKSSVKFYSFEREMILKLKIK